MPSAPSHEEIQRLVSLFKDGDMAALEPLARSFSQQYPQHGLGWMLVAAIDKAAGRNEQALAAQLKAIAVMPPKAELYSNLGNLQFALDKRADAEQSYRRCLQLDPRHAKGHFNYGLLLLALGRAREAESHLRESDRLQPDPQTRYQLALSLLEQKQYSPAVALLEQGLALRPGDAATHDSLSFAYLHLGRLKEAVEQGDAAVEAAPQDHQILGNLLFTLNYQDNRPGEVMRLARRYGTLVSAKAGGQRFTAWNCGPAPKLRIGFVSGDFKNHPVAFFLLSLLTEIDRTRFECFAYPTVPFEDDFSRRIKASVDGWKLLSTASDVEAASQIHADGIHVLVDLAGHTGHGRLPVFAFRPAPVQVSWLGYFSTTGLPEMDYVLADAVGVADGEPGQFTEAVRLLPATRLCFTPPEAAPEVAPLPAQGNGFVTFGCYQGLAKMNDGVLACWQAVFAALPHARLRWQCAQFADADARKATLLRLQRHGIDGSRVELLRDQSRHDYLDSYRHVDMVLDTFPFPGGTTTCEALWMGVPTLTLAGRSLLSRQGASLLTAAGLGDWVTTSPGEYQRRAIDIASRPAELAQLRQGLRADVATSPLFDRGAFARDFEATVLSLWEKHGNMVRDSSRNHHEDTD
jgi:predicted O-linked N-acetylglucosamine transferase (SPINDLY family)